jgi:hypothetical protein
MFSTDTSKSNIGPAGLDPNLLYQSADLASHFDVHEATAERLDRHLTTPRRTGERTDVIKVGPYALVPLNVWLQVHRLVVPSIAGSLGGSQS